MSPSRLCSLFLPLLFLVFPNSATPRQESGSSSILSPNLQVEAKSQSETLISVSVVVQEGVMLEPLLKACHRLDKAGVHIVRGKVRSKDLYKLAATPGVTAVVDSGPRVPPAPADPDLDAAQKPKVTREQLQKSLHEGPSYRQAAEKDSSKKRGTSHTKSWWGKDLLGVQEAWDLGFEGQGVKIAIMDTGVDFANPDLMDTVARVEIPASPHFGWPLCFDGRSAEEYFLYGETEDGWIVDTQSTPAATVHGVTSTAEFVIQDGDFPETRTLTFFTESVSGVYHFGLHPDNSLREEVLFGSPATVLVVDHADVGVRGPGYNTVYVDLNGDFDFTDEKPCFLGDEISYRDILVSETQSPGADGFPDVSGGMVYYIANGVRPFPAADWLYDAPVPDNGSIVAFMLNDYLDDGGNHGTTCASAAVAQGLINGDPPPVKPAFTGPGNGMVQGPAQEAKIVSVGNFYAGGSFTDYQLFCAYGYDGEPGTGDEPNIVSMSFGNGSIDNDGWNFESRIISSLNRRVAPQTTWMASTGNGAPGYGTLTSPQPPGAISVGACTSYDTCDEFDSILDLDQILAGDVQNFSGSGPAATGDLAVSVVAHGAWGSGNAPLNQAKDGWTAWVQWGGTSRSCPEAAGVVALIYQAYRSKTGDWPTFDQARQLLMNSAVDLGYSPESQGAGRVHAGRAAKLASGMGGIAISPEQLAPGGFRGESLPGYTRFLYPGGMSTETLQIHNPGPAKVNLGISDTCLESFGSLEFSLPTQASTAEERLFRKPDYLHLFQGLGTESIPIEAKLVSFDMIYPFETFDTNYVAGDTSTVSPPRENNYRLLVYDWKDQDGDMKLWDDSLGSVPGLVETSEIDAGEFMRFNYGYVDGTKQKVFVVDPLERMHDGIWVGARHRTGTPEGHATNLRVRATFYREVDCDWIVPGVTQLAVPANATESLQVTVNVPQSLSPGSYFGKILLAPEEGPDSVVPVGLNVAADFASGGFMISGATEGEGPYSNHTVSGHFSWDGRSEAGDGRFFFFDAAGSSPGSYLLTQTSWQDELPSDIDTVVLGPAEDDFTTPGSAYYHPDFGPNTLVPVGGQRSPGGNSRTFLTSSGGTSDLSVSPLVEGLHGLFLHNILFSGKRFAVPFQVQAGILKVEPFPLESVSTQPDVQVDLTLTSGVPLENPQFSAYGPSPVSHWYVNQSIMQGFSYWWQIDIADCGLVEIDLNGTARDLDLYVYLDGADGSTPDRQFSYDNEYIAGSFSLGSTEKVTLPFPADGFYRFLAYGYSVLSPTDTFNLTGRILSGQNVTVTPGKGAKIQANQPTPVGLSFSLPSLGEFDVLLAFGPAQDPQGIGFRIPVTYYRPGDIDFNDIQDSSDIFGLAGEWKVSDKAPIPIDYDRNSQIDASDLLRFIGGWRD